MPKKDLMIVLPYLGKLSLQIRTKIIRVMKNKLPHSNFRIAFQTKSNLVIFFTFKVKTPYVLALFINLSELTAMLPITAKLSAILKSQCVNNLEFLLLLEREWKGITIPPYKSTMYFAITCLVLTIFPY